MADPVLIPFKAHHLRAFEDRDKWMHSGRLQALQKELSGPAFTGIIEDRIIGCAGVLIPWPGVGLAWVTMTPEAAQHGLWLTRTVRRILDDVERAFDLHRMEAVILAGNETNQRWAEFLKFKSEKNGTARKYDSDQRDAVRYERVRDG